MASTPTEEIVAIMRTLTFSQQFALAKKARDFATQNRPKPQKSDDSANAPAAGTEVAARLAPNRGGSSSGAPGVSEKRLPVAKRSVAAKDCEICGVPYGLDYLPKHMKDQHPNGANVHKLPTTPHQNNRKNKNGNAANMVDGRTPLATRLAHEPAVPVKWIPVPPVSQEERTSTKSHYYDDGTGVRVFQGGLCNRK